MHSEMREQQAWLSFRWLGLHPIKPGKTQTGLYTFTLSHLLLGNTPDLHFILFLAMSRSK